MELHKSPNILASINAGLAVLEEVIDQLNE
jgi:hypothetical protein